MAGLWASSKIRLSSGQQQKTLSLLWQVWNVIPCDPAFILLIELVPLYAVELPALHKFP